MPASIRGARLSGGIAALADQGHRKGRGSASPSPRSSSAPSTFSSTASLPRVLLGALFGWFAYRSGSLSCRESLAHFVNNAGAAAITLWYTGSMTEDLFAKSTLGPSCSALTSDRWPPSWLTTVLCPQAPRERCTAEVQKSLSAQQVFGRRDFDVVEVALHQGRQHLPPASHTDASSVNRAS